MFFTEVKLGREMRCVCSLRFCNASTGNSAYRVSIKSLKIGPNVRAQSKLARMFSSLTILFFCPSTANYIM